MTTTPLLTSVGCITLFVYLLQSHGRVAVRAIPGALLPALVRFRDDLEAMVRTLNTHGSLALLRPKASWPVCVGILSLSRAKRNPPVLLFVGPVT